MTTYAVKETFRTLQGEGRHAGRAAVFLRFSPVSYTHLTLPTIYSV